MNNRIKQYHIVTAGIVFVLLPLALFYFGDFARRSTLKESLSILTLLGFSFLLGQFYWARSNQSFIRVFRFSRVLDLHKFIGYTVTIVFLAHPFLIVIPRSFEGGTSSTDALFQIVTTFDSLGVVLGLISWFLLLVIGLSSLFRNRLNMRYTRWKLFHGLLASTFAALAAWHAISLGRHVDAPFSVFIGLLSVLGIMMLLRQNFFSTRLSTGGR